jgi:hypothetical protein
MLVGETLPGVTAALPSGKKTTMQRLTIDYVESYLSV